MRICLDIETRKVPVDPPILSRGRPVTKRWQVFMVGVKMVGGGRVYLFEGSEKDIFGDLAIWLIKVKATKIYYEATRSFDEMILRGRFINARREFLEDPGPWPHFQDADNYFWINLGAGPEQNPDGLGKGISLLYEKNPETVREHCRWDVDAMERRILLKEYTS